MRYHFGFDSRFDFGHEKNFKYHSEYFYLYIIGETSHKF